MTTPMTARRFKGGGVTQPIPREQPMSEKEQMITTWADKSYRNYEAASCNQRYEAAVMYPDRCFKCGIYAFSPASEKHNAVLSYR